MQRFCLAEDERIRSKPLRRLQALRHNPCDLCTGGEFRRRECLAPPVKSRTSPAYPDIAKNMHLKGTVRLQLMVRADGTVKGVYVVGGHPMLAAAAELAV